MSEPSLLYKYRSVTDLSLDALAQARIWYSKPAGLNDPNDVAPRWQKDFSAREILEDFVARRQLPGQENTINDFIKIRLASGRTYEQILKQVDKMFMRFDKKPQRELLQDVLYYNETMFCSFGVLSLAETANNNLMWSHYSDSHRGFCMGFEYHETNILGQYGDRVTYVEKMPKPSIASFSMDAGGEVIHQIAYTKSSEWAYEQEWRVLKQAGNCLYPYPGQLREVIFGLKIPKYQEEQIRAAIATSGCQTQFKRAIKPEDAFNISFLPA